jgi:hypothetical protein
MNIRFELLTALSRHVSPFMPSEMETLHRFHLSFAKIRNFREEIDFLNG